MLHEQLMDKLINFKEMSDIGRQQRALRAVAELHKPVKDDYLSYVDMDACGSCGTPVPYPCPTIETIKAAINVI